APRRTTCRSGTFSKGRDTDPGNVENSQERPQLKSPGEVFYSADTVNNGDDVLMNLPWLEVGSNRVRGRRAASCPRHARSSVGYRGSLRSCAGRRRFGGLVPRHDPTSESVDGLLYEMPGDLGHGDGDCRENDKALQVVHLDAGERVAANGHG